LITLITPFIIDIYFIYLLLPWPLLLPPLFRHYADYFRYFEMLFIIAFAFFHCFH